MVDPVTFFQKPLTLRSLVGDGGVSKIDDAMVAEFTEIGGKTPYQVPASPLNLLHTCDDPILAAKIFTIPRGYVGAPIYIAVIDDCLVTPRGAVVTADGSLLLESLYSHSANNFMEGFSGDIEKRDDALWLKGNGPVATLDQDVVYNRDIGEYGYFHWINSILPRFDVAAHIANLGDKKFIMSRSTPFARRSLELLDISVDDVVEPTGSYQHCRRLYFISPWVLAGNHWTRPPEIKSFYEAFKERIGVAPSDPSAIVYLSRNDASVRRLVNEPAVVGVVERFGGSAVATSGMNLEEQAALFDRTKLCISVHGAGLSNLVFMQPDAAVIEIISPDRLWPTYRSLAARMGLRYAAVSGSRVETEGVTRADAGSLEAGNYDIRVDPDCIEFALSQSR